MTSLTLAMAVIGASYAGMTGLCLSMERHYKQVFKSAPDILKQRLLYWSGWLLLALAFAYSVAVWGGALGPVAWFGALTAAAGLLVFLLSYRDRIAIAAAAVSLILALTCPVMELLP